LRFFFSFHLKSQNVQLLNQIILCHIFIIYVENIKKASYNCGNFISFAVTVLTLHPVLPKEGTLAASASRVQASMGIFHMSM